MHLGELKQNKRKNRKRVGRGGKRGTYSGKGMKGQKSRSGAGIKPGFRGGDNRLWQLFPKKRGAGKKPGGSGNTGPHKKHRYFQLKHSRPAIFNLSFFNQFPGEEVMNKAFLKKYGFISNPKKSVKVLSDGDLKKKFRFEGFGFSKTARTKVKKAGGTIK